MLGTSAVGRAVGGRLDELGHVVVVGTRDPGESAGREEYAAWASEHAAVGLRTFGEAVAGAELVVNAAGGDVCLGILESAGAEHLAGKVLLDLSNPLDHSQGFPPRLFVKDDDSLAEQIQREFPDTRVVKTRNTMNSSVMVDPARLGEATSVPVSRDDATAKATVTALLHDLGHIDVIDLGELVSAPGAEMWLPLWIRLATAWAARDFNMKVVRGPGLDG